MIIPKCQSHIYPLVEEAQMLQEELVRTYAFIYPHSIDHFKLVNDYDEPRYMAVNSYDNCKNI